MLPASPQALTGAVAKSCAKIAFFSPTPSPNSCPFVQMFLPLQRPCKALLYLDSTIQYFFNPSRGSGEKKKSTQFLCVPDLTFKIHEALTVCTHRSGKHPVFFSNPPFFFYFLLLPISTLFFSLRKFCLVFALLLFLVFSVCAAA